MTSLITVIPASSRAGRETICSLLTSENPPNVRGIYRDPAKAPAEFTENPRFEAVKGDVGSDEDLDFSQSSAVLYVPPPTYDGSDQGEFATKAAHNVGNALKKANVKRLVLHSALGAQYDHGIGILRINHISDTLLKESVPEVVIVKPGWYFEIWAPALQTMQGEQPSFESPFSPADYEFPQVSVRDIGQFCATALIGDPPKSSPYVVDFIGPRSYSSLDVKNAIEKITGKKGSLITVSRENLPEHLAKEVPEVYVPEYVELIHATLRGGLLAEGFGLGDHVIRGKTEVFEALELLSSQ